MDGDTFRGRINIAMSYLKANFPDKQVILLTPIHRGYARFGDNNIQPDESYPNSLGLYADAYVDAVKEAANVWAVPVIDLNSICGLYPNADSHARYFHDARSDRLHPNAEGITGWRRRWHTSCRLILQISNSAMSCEAEARKRVIYRVTFVGFVVNLVLTAMKFAAGIVGRSGAMVADAVHSCSDMATDVVVIAFAKISAKPRDDGHDYGHGKYETLATIIISLALAAVGAGILLSSIRAIRIVVDGGSCPPGRRGSGRGGGVDRHQGDIIPIYGA